METLLEGVRAIVFDAVGTVLHPDPAAPLVYAEVSQRYGSRLPPASIARRFATAFAKEETLDREAGLRTSEARERERWQRIVAYVLDDALNIDACFRELYEHFGKADAWQCDPDAAQTIPTLARRGYVLGMASNYDHRLRRVIAGLPALKDLQYLIISSEIGWRKPAMQFFEAVCGVIGLSPREILYVGDDLVNDFEAAQAAGMRAILFDPTCPQASAKDGRIRKLTELLNLCRGNRRR